MKITSSIRGIASKLKACGVVISGHFCLKSGFHSLYYVAKENIVANPALLSELCFELALQFKEDRIETVIAPAVLGGPIAHAVALHLASLTGKTVNAVIAEKCQDGGFMIGRSYPNYVQGRKVLIVDDVATKGTTIRELMQVAWKLGATVVGVGVLIDRSGGERPIFKVRKFYALISLGLPTYEKGRKTCPGCRKEQALSKTHGHSKRKGLYDRAQMFRV